MSDLDASVAFHSKLLGAEPAKLRPGYANFALTDPPLKLVLIEGTSETTTLDHLGVQVDSTEQDTTCRFARQDKVWTRAPGHEPWEVYVVKADTDTFGDETCCAS